MHDLSFSAWQTPYEEALSESDERKLLKRIDAAETAIFRRLLALADVPQSYAELQAMDAALTNLLILKREKHNFSHWKPDSVEEGTDVPYRPN
jgi:hypothetical protein